MTSQLKMGMKVESEHKPTYNYLKRYVKKYGRLPSMRNFEKHIASNHISEDKRYYTKLKKLKL